MTDKKRFLALLLSALMLVSLCPVSARAEDEDLIDIIEFEEAAEPEEEQSDEELIPVLTRGELDPAAVTRTISDSYVNPLYPELEAELHRMADEPAAVRSAVNYEECDGLAGLTALLKAKMLQRGDTLYFLMHTEETTEVKAKELVDAACAHSGVPNEGDYLFLHFGSSNLNASEIPVREDGEIVGYDYEGMIRLTYLTTAAEELTVDAAVGALIDGLGLNGLSETEKMLSVYSAVCRAVEAEEPESEDQHHTAYAALIDGKASDKGIAALLYRLMLEAGVDCRYVTGRVNGLDQSWNIVKIGDKYYHADAFNDAGRESFVNCLKGSQDFPSHLLAAMYRTAQFQRLYPLAETGVDLSAFAPRINTQPKSVTAYVGDSADFSVKASGYALTYQWYYRTSSKGSWKACSAADAKKATMSVEAKDYRNGYQYRCEVKNNSGSVYTSAVTLTVKPLTAPVVTAQPQNAAAAVGESVSFSVAVEGGHISYQWYYRSSASGSWSKCSGAGADTDTLTVEVKAYRSGYQYRCKAANSLGSVYSSAATLSVMPGLTAQPQDVTAAVGAQAVFTVSASGPDLSYQWYFRKSASDTWSKSSGDSAATASLSVEVKSYRDGYQYRCRVTNAAGSVDSQAASLHVLAKPAIGTQPQDVTTAPGTTAVFRVTASGENLSYQWQYRKSDTDTWTNSSGTSAATASLSVEVKSYRDGYQYRCRVTNAAGSVYSVAAVLHVLAVPTISTQPQDVTAALGATAVFSVTASGEGLSYQWQFRKSDTDSWSNCSGDSASTASLSVEAKSYRDGYQYRCKVTNAAGSVYSEAAVLTVS